MNNKKEIDIETWARKDKFKYYQKAFYPFYSITTKLDITNLKKYTKNRNISFYETMVWICSKAINQINEFKIRIIDNKPYLYDITNPSFTYLKKGSEEYIYLTMPYKNDLNEFLNDIKLKVENNNEFLDGFAEADNLIYLSCIPWFDYTGITNAHENNFDTIPRFGWGKYFEENGRLMMHFSIEVNHMVIDGVHIAKLLENINSEINKIN